jgi:uncharacterized protein
MGRVTHFEITADEPERAVGFYKTVFGWDIDRWDGPQPYWLITGNRTERGIDGAIMARHASGQKVICTIDVDSWDEAAETIKAAGGKVITEKDLIPGVGTFAYCVDTEGNLFGIMEIDPNRKMG